MDRSNVDYALYLVTDRVLAGDRSIASIMAAAVAGGVSLVQVREKGLDTRAFLDEALLIRDLLEPHGVPLIVNDRLDVALACGAAGVHVGQHDLPCAAVRRLAGPGMLIGVSVSTVAEAIAAERDGADYLGVSPVFATPTKTDTPAATGLQGLRQIRAAVRLPLVAIGGMHVGNAAEVVGAGADGVAVVSAIMSAADPQHAAAALRRAVGKALGARHVR